MDLTNLARDLDKLATADAVVGDSYVRYVLKKAALYFLACSLALIGLILIGLALYWLLEQSLGPIAAAALVGVIGFILAGIVTVVAMIVRPGREFAVALGMRKSTLVELEQNIGSPGMGVGALVYPASEVLVSSVLLPLLGTLIRSLKSHPAGQPDANPPELANNAEPASPAARQDV